MAKVTLFNMDCLDAMRRIADDSVDCVLTSPPYVTSTHTSETKPHTLTDVKSKGYPWLRYDVFNDTMSNEDFADWQSRIFRELDRILKPNGCVIYNISYSAGNTTCWIDAVYQIIHNSPFTMADKIVWKKKCALPNNHSPSQLTRICEDIFVFCRAKERTTFHCNKRVVSVTAHGQNNYENVMNFVEAGKTTGLTTSTRRRSRPNSRTGCCGSTAAPRRTAALPCSTRSWERELPRQPPATSVSTASARNSRRRSANTHTKGSAGEAWTSSPTLKS